MTRDKKIALFIAPFLLIGGYIAADYYAEYRDAERAKQTRLYELSLQGTCDMVKEPCLLTSHNLQVKLSDKVGLTSLQSNLALDAVTISYLDASGQEQQYQFTQGDNRQHWEMTTGFYTAAQQASAITLRLMVTINTAYYLSEFTATGQLSGHGN